MNPVWLLVLAGAIFALRKPAASTLRVRAIGGGTLFINGKKVADLPDAAVKVPVKPAVNAQTVRVDFADGSSSTERQIVFSPGRETVQQVFVPVGVNLGQVSYTAQSERLASEGKTERANAVSMLADAQNMMLTRQYEAASAKYAEIIATFPGTPEDKAARMAKFVLDQQLRTAVGRAALDRANPMLNR
jgi:hypothetical protein